MVVGNKKTQMQIRSVSVLVAGLALVGFGVGAITGFSFAGISLGLALGAVAIFDGATRLFR